MKRDRRYGQRFAPNYPELRFEGLLTKREERLLRISRFVDYDLASEEIQKNALGTLKDSNFSFRSRAGAES